MSLYGALSFFYAELREGLLTIIDFFLLLSWLIATYSTPKWAKCS